MNQIVLENVNPNLVEKLQILANKHNRSLEDEIKVIIAQVAEAEVIEEKNDIATAWSKIEEARQRHSGQVFSDSVELLREERNR
ncbi:MAG: hypothetical protein WBB28_20180 [Crinalium sp.]|uniref:Arc-like DNA binding domain-containing protein n=1 Tax=Crinalium epipsammum PCC 9333 TaxID=1173022 RepID=K9W489_9CYAN|nr:hypothetical protein [Crinalium epipsammum]AFZ14270.1 hypothetical protein Cri9333_3445 [Crinalium epipsammum PCC 9333]